MEDGGGQGGLWGWTDRALIVRCDKVRLSGLSIGRISGRVDMRVSHAERQVHEPAGKQSASCIRTSVQEHAHYSYEQ